MDRRAGSPGDADRHKTVRSPNRSLERISSMKPVRAEVSKTALDRARVAYAAADSNEPRARTVRYSRARDAFVIELRNGITFIIPRRLTQGLVDATPADAARLMIFDKGAAVGWPALDVYVTIPGLVSGVFGSKAWMSELGRAGGSRRSPARAAASRANGRRGGRPRKQPTPTSKP